MSKPPELTQTKQWGRESSNPERLTEDGHLSREQKEERLAGENPGGGVPGRGKHKQRPCGRHQCRREDQLI